MSPPPQATNIMKARSGGEIGNNNFAATQSDRSELEMSNAMSSGLPGLGTLRAGITITSPSKIKNFHLILLKFY